MTLCLFTNQATVFVGLISYPLYLWHWSVLSLSRWANLDYGWFIPLQLVVMFLLSVATYRYIERPLRHAEVFKPNWRAISIFIAASTCCAITVAQFRHIDSLFGWQSAAQRLMPGNERLTATGLNFDPTCIVYADKRPLRDTTFDLCTVLPKQPGGQMIWTLGDSHAGHLQAMLLALRERVGVGVHLIETTGIAFPMPHRMLFEPRRRIYDMIAEKLRPGDIVLLARLFLDRTGDGLLEDIPEWSIELVKLARELTSRKVNVVVVGPPVMFGFNSLVSCWMLPSQKSVCEIDRTAAAKRVEDVHRIVRAAAKQSDNIFLFDTFDEICPVEKATCSPFRNGHAIFYDKDHFNNLGAELLTGPFVKFLKTNGLLAEPDGGDR